MVRFLQTLLFVALVVGGFIERRLPEKGERR